MAHSVVVRFFIRIFLFCGLVIPTFLSFGYAQEKFRVDPSFAVGMNVKYGLCPCIRFTYKIRTLTGSVRVRNILFSTDSLLKLDLQLTPAQHRVASNLVQLGALDAIGAGDNYNRVGLSFDGITVGSDLDRSYAGIFKTGISILAYLAKTAKTTFEARSGYEYEHVDLSAQSHEYHNLTSSLRVNYKSKNWSSRITGKIKLDASSLPDDLKTSTYSLETNLEAKLPYYRKHHLLWGLDAHFERDRKREYDFGIEGDEIYLGMYIEMGFVK